MKVIHRGVELTQAQLDAIVPILNLRLENRTMSMAKFEALCEEAMADAGVQIVVLANHVCRHCNQSLRRGDDGLWREDGHVLTQYCWIDEQQGSQLHEPIGE